MRESHENNNKNVLSTSSTGYQSSQLSCVSCVINYFSIYQTFGKLLFCITRLVGINAPFHCFKQVIILAQRTGHREEQGVITTNNNLLFQLSGHHDDLFILEVWKVVCALGYYF